MTGTTPTPSSEEVAADLRRHAREILGYADVLDPPSAPAFRSEGARLIALERSRQVEGEGYQPDHDAEHPDLELAWAAYCYLTQATADPDAPRRVPSMWPWKDREWKPKPDRVRNLVIAGALIAAEIDRTATTTHQEESP